MHFLFFHSLLVGEWTSNGGPNWNILYWQSHIYYYSKNKWNLWQRQFPSQKLVSAFSACHLFFLLLKCCLQLRCRWASSPFSASPNFVFPLHFMGHKFARSLPVSICHLPGHANNNPNSKSPLPFAFSIQTRPNRCTQLPRHTKAGDWQATASGSGGGHRPCPSNVPVSNNMALIRTRLLLFASPPHFSIPPPHILQINNG